MRAGTYDQDVLLANSGTSASPITARAEPGERAEVRCWFETAGDHIVLEGFEIDGSYGSLLQSPYDDNGVNTRPALGVNVRSNFVTARNIEIHNRRYTLDRSRAGQGVFVQGNNFTLKNSRLYHDGQIPANNHEHNIYITTGDNFTIRDNIIYESADGGLQMYPHAGNGLIEGNIFAYNGDPNKNCCGVAMLFGSSGQNVSANNVMRVNVIAYTTSDYNVEAGSGQLNAGVSFPGAGSANWNEVVGNCCYHAELP